MGARPAIITCAENVSDEDDPASNVVELPCLAMLSAELWAALLAEGADVQVAIDMERCETCAKAGGPAQALYAERIAQAEEWTQRNVGFATSLPQAANEGNGTQFNKFASHGRVKRAMGSSRNLLLQALDTQPDMAARVELSLPEIDADACEGCLRCTRTCPTGALAPDAQDGTLTLDWRYCIGCGLCESACPRNAITLTTKPISEAAC